MTPILFSAGTKNFTTNGIGRLADVIRCTVTEERNGAYELEMEYPVDGAHYADIAISAIVGAVPADDAQLQAFRIYKISKAIGGRVTVSAEHISYQMNHIPAAPFTADNLTNAMKGFKTNAAETCPFTLSADFTSNSTFAMPDPASIRSYLGGRDGSILDIYGGEYEWDNYNVILHKSRGANRGVTLRYGKNIIDLVQEENIENTYTGVYPYWRGDEENMLQLPEKVLHAATAGNFPYQRTVVLDCSDQFENEPTEAELRTYAQNYMKKNNIGIPVVNVKVNFVDLSKTEQYADVIPLQSVRLCDTLNVYFERLGINATAKVIKTEYNVLLDRYDSIEVGDASSTLAQTIEQQIGDATSDLPTASEVRSKVDHATGVLNKGLGGHVMINRNKQGWANEILWLDNENAAKAKNVLRINVNGIGFSTDGYQGSYRNAWTIDGNLSADFLRSGSLVLGGGTYNVDGSLVINDVNGKEVIRGDKNGVTISTGTLTAPNISGGTIRGSKIEGNDIEGGTLDIGGGMLQADDEQVQIGPFYTFESDAGNVYLAFEDESAGLGSNGDYQFWTGWHGGEANIRSPKDILNKYGTVISEENMYAQEIYLADDIFQGRTHWWGVGESINDLYELVYELQDEVDRLSSRSDD